MNNTDWKILIYLKEERSINKVAKRLFMTQPSLTYRLGQMEKEIPGHRPRPGQFLPLRRKDCAGTQNALYCIS